MSPLRAASRSRWRSAAPSAASAKRLSATGLLLEGPGAGKLGDRGEKRDTSLRDTQAPHQGRRIFAKIFGLFDAGGDFVKERVGPFLDKAGQEGPFFDCDAAQKGAVAENRREQAFAGTRGAPLPREIRGGLPLCQGERLVPGVETEGEPARVGRFRQPATIGGEVR